MKTLLIEQAAEDYSTVYQCLRRTNLEIESVCGGRRAVERAAQEDFDLIILDLVQPVESCLLALHEIRESGRDCEILILADADQVKDRVTALIQGADDYLVKPVDSCELRTRIATLARRRGQSSAPGAHARRGDHSRLDRMIENLRQLSQRDDPAVELVISEANLALLIDNTIDRLRETAATRAIRIERARSAFPGVLVDACWMEHLLAVLLNDALLQSPANSVISVRFDYPADPDRAIGTLSIEAALARVSDAPDARYPRGIERRLPVDSQVLAQFCADTLRLAVEYRQPGNRYLQIRVGNLRLR